MEGVGWVGDSFIYRKADHLNASSYLVANKKPVIQHASRTMELEAVCVQMTPESSHFSRDDIPDRWIAMC